MDVGTARPGYDSVLAFIRRRESGYLRLNSLTAAAADYIAAEDFCRDTLDVALADMPSGSDDRTRFFAWACAMRPGALLLHVLAAHQALSDGRIEEAERLAGHASAAHPNDLHVQRLRRECRQRLDTARAKSSSENLQGRFCRAPFENLETAPNGDVHFCCTAWLPAPIGNINQQSADDIWNSPAAQEIRGSILDGSYRYCSRVHCPHISGNKLPRADKLTNELHRRIVAGGMRRLARGPRKLVLSHDKSCNLSCPSCRTQLILARKPEQDRLNELAERTLFPLLRTADRVRITGSGDPFASNHFRHVMAEIARWAPPRPLIELQTNGLLLDEAAWRELGLGQRVDKILVSIDAARPETYRVLRRGGSFERLMENLEFIASLRRAGEVAYIRLDCVLQAHNYAEMPDIVALTRRFGFDGVKFQMIRNWNTYDAAEFARHNIASPGHPEYQAFLTMLRDPRLAAPDIELWGMSDAALAAAAARPGSGQVDPDSPDSAVN